MYALLAILLIFAANAAGQLVRNPADLGNLGSSRFTIEVPGASGLITNNSFPTSYWNSRIAGDYYWDSDEVSEILGHIPDGGFKAGGRTQVSILGARYQHYAFAAELKGAGFANVPKEIAEFALLGTQLNQAFQFSNLIGTGYLLADYQFSYGHAIPVRKIPGLTGGATVHIYSGQFFSSSDDGQGSLLMTEDLISGSADFSSATATSGSGFGLDLGVTAPVSPRWNVALALRQIGASVNWSLDETSVTTFESHADGIALDSLDEDEYLDRVFQSETETIEGGSKKLTLAPYVELLADWTARPRLDVSGMLTLHPKETLSRDFRVETFVHTKYSVNRWFRPGVGFGYAGWLGPVFDIGAEVAFANYAAELSLTTGRGLFGSSYGGGFRFSQRVMF